jgi:hypothetical protein
LLVTARSLEEIPAHLRFFAFALATSATPFAFAPFALAFAPFGTATLAASLAAAFANASATACSGVGETAGVSLAASPLVEETACRRRPLALLRGLLKPHGSHSLLQVLNGRMFFVAKNVALLGQEVHSKIPVGVLLLRIVGR